MIWKSKHVNFPTLAAIIGLSIGLVSGSSPGGNFSCYQCATTSMDEKCGPETLKPCQQPSDRCVTHITKSPSTSLMVKRECGLGPCSFEKVNSEANEALGLNHCDVTKDDVFCVLCCKESGCNGAESIIKSSFIALVTSLLAAAILG